MKYLIINGSPRRKNTWKIVERVKQNLKSLDENNSFKEIDLINENIPSCIGCYNCFNINENQCPHYDNIKKIVDEMIECDCLIITSPVYALNVTGVMKNFIDHLAYFYHRPYFFNKKAIVIVTTAGSGHKKVGNYLNETLRNWGFNERYELFFVHAHDKHGYLPLKTKEKIDNVTKKFYENRNQLKSPSFKALFYYNLWRAMAYNGHIPEDKNYWTKHDMLNDEYYPDIPCSSIKKIPFKIFYRIMLNFINKNSVKQEKNNGD